MSDLEAIAKDAAERVHKNGGCVPQMAFAPILFALQDALSTTPAQAEALDEGAAELAAGLRGMARVFMETMDEEEADILIRSAVALETRATPPVPAQDDDKLRIAADALRMARTGYCVLSTMTKAKGLLRGYETALEHINTIDEALAALKSEGK